LPDCAADRAAASPRTTDKDDYQRMPRRLASLAAFLTTHWKRAALAAVLAFAAIAALGVVAGGSFSDDFAIPGAESQKARDVLESRFPAASGDSATVVYYVEDGRLRDGTRPDAIERSVDAIAEQPHVTGVTDPLDSKVRGQVSKDGRIAFATVQYDRPAIELEGAVDRLKEGTRIAEQGGVQAAMRGVVVDQGEEQEAPAGEVVGIALAVVLLTLLFRSLVAMAVTLIGALVGVGLGVLVLNLVAGVMTMPTPAPTLGLMLGLGAGIDYALLIVGRYREQRAAGDDPVRAAAKAHATAGMAVVAAGLIVIVAIAGLLTAGIPFVGKMGLGASVVVAGVVVSAITILPIALGAFAKRLAPKRAAHAEGSEGFARWGERITRHPVLATVAGVALLAALAFPATSMKLGQPDDSNMAPDATQRIAYDKLTEGFGPGFNAPLVLAVSLPEDDAKAKRALGRIPEAVAKAPGVLATTPAISNRQRTAAIVSVTPETSPQDERTGALIEHLRSDVLPAASAGTGAEVHVGGATATFKDMSDKIERRLPVFIGAVVVLSVLLLMAAFRSVWVPLASAAFNLLGIAAAYGAVTAVFNDGVGMGLIGLEETVPIVSFVPLMTFAILFGLSMDYNVFLLSRIREAYHEGDSTSGDAPKAAVIHGMARIGKVILVAGAIMAAVFAGFMITEDPIIKQMGFALSAAILIDVLIVRMLVAPAVVTLLGDHAWTLPRVLDRVLPEIHLEGEGAEQVGRESSGGHRADEPAELTV